MTNFPVYAPILPNMTESEKDKIMTATSPAEVRSALKALHAREKVLNLGLNALLTAKADIKLDFSHLDNLRTMLDDQARATRSINTRLAGTSDAAGRLSSQINNLSLEKSRVEDTLWVVDQVIELKACIAGVVGSMGAPQDWEAAAGYISRVSKIPEKIVRGDFAAAVVPTIEVPQTPWVALEDAKETLCGLFLAQFENAAKEGDAAKVTRFFKLFPLIGRGDAGLGVYGRYVCQGLADTARATLKEGANTHGRKAGFFFVNTLTKLFEHVAHIVENHGGLVERHYGKGKMVKVIERLQLEVDVQGGIIIDTWSDENEVDRELKDVRSYPFSFLAHSILSHPANGSTSRQTLSGVQDSQNIAKDGGIDPRELDRLLGEIAIMLGQWSIYSWFLANKLHDSELSESSHLSVPQLLINSNLYRKISEELINPYNTIAAFHFRRSVEMAFQLDTPLSGLSLTEPIAANPPFILQAVDDTMYCVSVAIQRAVSTAQKDVISSVVPAVGRILGSDYIGIIQRRMWNEYSWRSGQVGPSPTEDKIIAFIVLMNSLDISKDYLGRIIKDQLNISAGRASDKESNPSTKVPGLFENDLTYFTNALSTLDKAFSSKTTTLLNEGLQDFFKQLIRPRLRPIIASSFRGVDYSLLEHELEELEQENSEDNLIQQVARRFELGWDALMKPISRIMAPKIFVALLDLTARYLAVVLEKRLWSYAARVNELGALRMDRDFSGIVGIISRENYEVRDLFARVLQILMAANMEEEEWQEMLDEDSEDLVVQWLLSEDERKRARQIITT